MKTLKKGFTLIELLVVIAIIGILSSIVLASLSSARSKGEDAAIQSTLSSMRAQAELFYSNQSPGGYGTSTTNFAVCPTTAGVTSIFDSAATGGLLTLSKGLVDKAAAGTTRCGSLGTTWTAIATLRSNTGQYYCVDSTGSAKVVTSATPATGVAVVPCP